MDEAAAVLPGPSQPAFCPERRARKSGSANIFQGVNLGQLRRLFRAAGEPDAERRAGRVWRGEAGDDGDELAQALLGLRVRARTRTGIRAGPGRALGNARMNDRASVDPPKPPHDPAEEKEEKEEEEEQEEEKEEERHPRRRVPDRYLHQIRH